MNHKEIFDAAKSNNIRKLLRAKKEISQVHSARNITETMYLNDMAEMKRIIYQAGQMIDRMLEEVRNNMNARRKAYLLFGRDDICCVDDWRSSSVLSDESGWREILYHAFNQRYFNVASMEIEELYDEAKIHRIRTIILENGMGNIFHHMSMEEKKIRLDTNNIVFLSDMFFGIEGKNNEKMEPVKRMMEECLRNRLWINEGVINQRYFERIGEISHIINQYFKREETDYYDRI